MADGEDGGGTHDGARSIGLDPIGQALRATYDTENHDSLGRDLTGLMLELARVEPPVVPPVTVPELVSSPSWFARLLGIMRR